MKGKFVPRSAMDVLPKKDKDLIGVEYEWTVIGTMPKDHKQYPGQKMMAPPREAGFSFGWTPEEDILSTE